MKKIPWATLLLAASAVVLGLTAFAVIDETAQGIAGGLALWVAAKVA